MFGLSSCTSPINTTIPINNSRVLSLVRDHRRMFLAASLWKWGVWTKILQVCTRFVRIPLRTPTVSLASLTSRGSPSKKLRLRWNAPPKFYLIDRYKVLFSKTRVRCLNKDIIILWILLCFFFVFFIRKMKNLHFIP